MTTPALLDRPDDADGRRPARRQPVRHLTPATPTTSGTAGSEPPPAPDPRPSARRLSQALAEVLAGVRPARQLDDLAAAEVIRVLCRNAGRLTGPGGASHCPVIDSVHVREPCPAVAEACAVIDTGGRKRAIALRLEMDGARWRCTALHLG